jgi:hypothetical protein
MKKKYITLLRWISVIVGIGIAVAGFFLPENSNDTNNACWMCVFVAMMPLDPDPVKEKEEP